MNTMSTASTMSSSTTTSQLTEETVNFEDYLHCYVQLTRINVRFASCSSSNLTLLLYCTLWLQIADDANPSSTTMIGMTTLIEEIRERQEEEEKLPSSSNSSSSMSAKPAQLQQQQQQLQAFKHENPRSQLESEMDVE